MSNTNFVEYLKYIFDNNFDSIVSTMTNENLRNQFEYFLDSNFNYILTTIFDVLSLLSKQNTFTFDEICTIIHNMFKSTFRRNVDF